MASSSPLAQYISRALLLLSSPSPSLSSARRCSLCAWDHHPASSFRRAPAKLHPGGRHSKLFAKAYGGGMRLRNERSVAGRSRPFADGTSLPKAGKRGKKEGREAPRDGLAVRPMSNLLKSRNESGDGNETDTRARAISALEEKGIDDDDDGDDFDEEEDGEGDDDDDDDEDDDNDIVEELGEDFSSDGEMYMEISDTDDAEAKGRENEIANAKPLEKERSGKCDNLVSEIVQGTEIVGNNDVILAHPSVADELVDGSSHSSCEHPWKEWNAFFDMLKQKNYFKDVPELESDLKGEGYLRFQSSSYMKHAILEFSRERDDIIRFLTQMHIKTVVSVGCPVTDRKVVNASKRLRVMCQVSEDKVCQQCKLKTFCTRAFDVPNADLKSETLDVTRVLYAFALNASPIAESQVSYPIGVTKSVCHLLDEIVKVSAYPKEPGIPKPKPQLAVMPKVSEKDEIDNRNPNRRPGDWTCSDCNFVNFSKNPECRECGAKAPHTDAGRSENMMPGDWKCSECQFINFRRNNECRKCSASRSSNDGTREVEEELEPGDWRCPECKFRNFRKNKQCRKCGASSINQSRRDEIWGLQKASSSTSDSGRIGNRNRYEEWKPDLSRKLLEDSDDDLEENADAIFEDDDGPVTSAKASQRGNGLKGRVSWHDAIGREPDSGFNGNKVTDKYLIKTRKENGKPSRGFRSKSYRVEDEDEDDDDNDMEDELDDFGDVFSDDDENDEKPRGGALKWKPGRKVFKNWEDDSDDEDASDVFDDEGYSGRRGKNRGSFGRGAAGLSTRGRGRGSRGSLDSSDEDGKDKDRGGGRRRRGGMGMTRGGRGEGMVGRGMGMTRGGRGEGMVGRGMGMTRGGRAGRSREETGREGGRGRGRGGGERSGKGGERGMGSDRGERMGMARGRGGRRGSRGGGRGR